MMFIACSLLSRFGFFRSSRHVRSNQDKTDTCRTLVHCWAKTWDLPQLAGWVRLEWSSRLTKSLGQAYPRRGVVRLSTLLLDAKYAEYFKEVLCHELAHVAVYRVHGRKARPHGAEWQRLVRIAGFEPRVCIATDNLPAGTKERILFEHVCPVCGAKRMARRRQPRWHCVECRRAGLKGELVVRRRPSRLVEDGDG